MKRWIIGLLCALPLTAQVGIASGEGYAFTPEPKAATQITAQKN